MASNPTATTEITAANCGRCGRALRQRDGSCTTCEARVLPPTETASGQRPRDAISSAKPAPLRRRVYAALIDLAPVVILAAITWWLSAPATDALPFGVGGTLAGVYVLAQLIDYLRYGRTLGKRMLGIRTVDAVTGTPRLAVRLTHLLAADLRSGPDPLGLKYSPLVAFPLPRPSEQEALMTARHRLRGFAYVLTFESGTEIYVDREAILGRRPEQRHATTRDARPVVLADLSRTVANSHIRVVPRGDALWVTDLGSPQGTVTIDPGGVRQALAPGEAVPARSGTRIQLGQRVATVTQAATVAPAAPHSRRGDAHGQ